MSSAYPPPGYHYIDLWLTGSNVRAVRVLVCERCGSHVGIFTTHNEWHDRIARAEVEYRTNTEAASAGGGEQASER